jgi:hypothetical protein
VKNNKKEKVLFVELIAVIAKSPAEAVNLVGTLDKSKSVL